MRRWKVPRWPRCRKCGRYKRRTLMTYFGAQVKRWSCVYCDDPTPPGYLRLPE